VVYVPNAYSFQGSTARSPSISSYDDAIDATSGDTSGVVRNRLEPSQARSRFRPSRVDARDVDFSGRLGREGRWYRVSNRRRADGSFAEEDDDRYGDFSDEEDETLDRRIARLRREVEEIKIEFEAAQAKTGADVKNEPPTQVQAEKTTEADVLKLSETLDSIYTARQGNSKSAQAELAALIDNKGKSSVISGATTTTPTATEDLDPHLAQALFKTAEFESRLTFLEAALGLTGSNLPDQGPAASKPIIPSLDALDRQIQIISNAPSSLESAHSKTRQLVKDAERLQRLREANEDESNNPVGLANGHESTKSSEQSAKINALYGALTTIDNLSPTLPMVLERLRTLRTLHTSAAGAGETLDDIEKRQAEQAAEIEQWKQALQTAESHVKNGQSSLNENVEEVEKWVKNLEERLTKFN